jgi:hypothetical protein
LEDPSPVWKLLTYPSKVTTKALAWNSATIHARTEEPACHPQTKLEIKQTPKQQPKFLLSTCTFSKLTTGISEIPDERGIAAKTPSPTMRETLGIQTF